MDKATFEALKVLIMEAKRNGLDDEFPAEFDRVLDWVDAVTDNVDKHYFSTPTDTLYKA